MPISGRLKQHRLFRELDRPKNINQSGLAWMSGLIVDWNARGGSASCNAMAMGI